MDMDKKQKEQFKLIEKNLIKFIKSSAKENKYKAVSNSLYKRINDFFVHSVYFITNGENCLKLVVWNYIKTYQSDNLFWEIFDMKDNIKQRDSLRANGAYTMPSFKISEHSFDIVESTDLEEASGIIAKFILEEHNKFLESIYEDNKTFNQYLLNQKSYLREELIKMLANVELNDFSEARRMAQEEITKGNRGGFQNNNEDIYQYILKYCEKQ
jgi:hypothetical protein